MRLLSVHRKYSSKEDCVVVTNTQEEPEIRIPSTEIFGWLLPVFSLSKITSAQLLRMMNHHSSHRLPIRSSSFLRHRRQEDNSPIFYFWRRFVVCIFVVILSEVGIFGSRSGSSSDRSRNQHLLDTEPNHHHHPARGSSSLFASAFSSQDPQSSKPATRVLVTGAAGKTGRIILRKLEDDPRYEPKALVRTENSARDLIKSDDVKCPLAHVVIADITSPTFLEDLPKLHHQGLDSLEAMIICTSAVPRISKVSLIRAVLKAPFNMIRRKPIVDFRSLQFKWKNGGYPELVDYQGQVAQIELAKMLGIKHVVVVSSMGGTDPNNFLNSVGKSKKDGSGNGDILLWKRRAEKYLVEVR